MKATLRLTLDGLTRALRTRVDRMAKDIDTGYPRSLPQGEAEAVNTRGIGENDDDVSGD